MTTLRELLDQHPDWANLPIVVGNPRDFSYNYVGENSDGRAYKGTGKNLEEVVVFATLFDPLPESYEQVTHT